jgi:uncharacterized protein
MRIKLACLLVLFIAGCQPEIQKSEAGLDVVKMRIGSNTYKLEVARKDAERNKGLMDRDSLDADRGMIFVFSEQKIVTFWMKNVKFPLDIVFLDSHGGIVAIKQMKPMDETGVDSLLPARYAIELKEGTAKAENLRIGQLLDLPKGVD